jgi:hypothetical protein
LEEVPYQNHIRVNLRGMDQDLIERLAQSHDATPGAARSDVLFNRLP